MTMQDIVLKNKLLQNIFQKKKGGGNGLATCYLPLFT